MDLIVSFDRSLFLLLNGLHTSWLDPVMMLISSKWIWIPFYLFLLYRLWVIYKKDCLKILFSVALLITLTDQTSGLIKDAVKRPRPTHQEGLSVLVHTVDGYKGGKFGFVSSHAANSFAIALFIGLLLSRKRSMIPLIGLFIWASLVSYSRIYLGVHYPGDILGGALIGVIEACLFFLILLRWGGLKDDKYAATVS